MIDLKPDSTMLKIAALAMLAFLWTAVATAQIELRNNQLQEKALIDLPQAQPVQAQAFRRINFAAGMMPAERNVGDDETIFEDSGTLKTDPDLESIMEKADRYRQDGNYRVATQLWQTVLERSGDSLFSTDGEIYFSMTRQVERALAELPSEGLAVYRVKADAEAKAILGQADHPQDPEALNRIVQRYFISSQGDEAAFDLGCFLLDEYNFLGARRLFEKIVQHYPDPSVSLAEVHARIALCNAFLGDTQAAREATEKARELDRRSSAVELVARALENGDVFENWQPVDDAVASWKMPLANHQRYGVGLPPNADLLKEGQLVAVWHYAFEPKERFNSKGDLKENLFVGKQAIDEESIQETQNRTESTILKSWSEHGWQPVGQLAFSHGRMFFKTGYDLVAWDLSRFAATGDFDSEEISSYLAWRSVWQNSFEIDRATQMHLAILKNYGAAFGGRRGVTKQTSSEPDESASIQLFGDAIAAQLSVHRGVVFSIEGPNMNLARRSTPLVPQWNQPYRRTRENYLSAYDAKTGKALWTLPRNPGNHNNVAAIGDEGEPESPWLEDGGFMSAPVGYRNLAIVPVNKGGAIMVYGLDLNQQGKTVWKSYLCDEPEAGANSWSPINMSIDGSDLLVNTGLGVMFSLDPGTGAIRFARPYPRVGKLDDFYRRSNWSVKRGQFEGWSSDTVLPYRRQLITFASDSNLIEAIDRDSGQMVWRSEINPIGYKVNQILGVYQDTLFTAGPETIIAYDLQGEGRMVWGADQQFDGKQATGRGLLTPDGLFIPVQDKIYHFGLDGDRGRANLIKKIHVDLGGAPLGNLFSDGERFWVHGGNRLYALGVKSE